MELQGLSTYCLKHGGGFTVAQYAPWSWFEYSNWMRVVNESTGMLLKMPEFKTTLLGASWLTLPAVVHTDRGFDTLLTRSKQGNTEEQSLTAYLASLRPEAEMELMRMAEMRYFLVILKDKNNQKWLLGDLDYPCEFGYDFSGGAFSTAANKVKVNFKSKNSFPMVGVQ